MKISVLELIAKDFTSRELAHAKLGEFDLIGSTIVLQNIAHSLSLVHGANVSRNDRELAVLKFGQGLRDSVEIVSGVNLASRFVNYMEPGNGLGENDCALLHLLGRKFLSNSEPIDCDADDLINSLLVLHSTCRWHLLRRTNFVATNQVAEEWRKFQKSMTEILVKFTGINPNVAVLSNAWWLKAMHAPII